LLGRNPSDTKLAGWWSADAQSLAAFGQVTKRQRALEIFRPQNFAVQKSLVNTSAKPCDTLAEK
jgi:hypothetical protein